MPKLRLDLLAPFLLTTYPIIFFYSTNFYLVEVRDVLITLVVAVISTLVLTVIVILLTRHFQRGLFIASALVLLFFTYGHIYNNLVTAGYASRLVYLLFDNHLALLVVWAALLITALVIAFRQTRRLRRINHILSLVAAGLLAVSLIAIGLSALTPGPAQAQPKAAIEVHPPQTLPDVYYIILDEYAGNPALLNSLGYDNSQFTRSLEARGFEVIENARSNYFMTAFSLASTLNMEYLDSLYGHLSHDIQPLIAMIRNNATTQTFKSMGYTYIHFATYFEINRENEFADMVIYRDQDDESLANGNWLHAIGLNDFHITLGKTTVLAPLMKTLEEEDSRVRNLSNFKTLAEIPRMEAPTFTLAHFILPHYPFVFDQDDGPIDPDQPVDGQIVDVEKYRPFAPYVDQIIFTNRAVSQAVDEILSQSETDPIIIIQSDHGYREICSDCRVESEHWNDAYYADVILPVLSAYYLPNGGDERLYETISPVNVFRVIFDHYFGANLGLVEDRYYRPENYRTRRYHFQDITTLVKDHQARDLE